MSSSDYAPTDITVDQGEDEGSPANEAAVWDWLTSGDSGMSLAERMEQAEFLGRDDIVQHLRGSASRQ